MRGFKAKLGVTMIIGMLALAACSAPLPPGTQAGAGASPLATPTTVSEAEELPPAALEVQKALAGELAVEAQNVSVLRVEAVDWSDSCLGAGGPAEICAAVITPGYRITLNAEGKQYLVHANADGSNYRIVDAPAP